MKAQQKNDYKEPLRVLIFSTLLSAGSLNTRLAKLAAAIIEQKGHKPDVAVDVYPNMFSLALAHQTFAPDGSIADETLSKRFETNLMSFLELVASAKHYPFMKKAWVEYLRNAPIRF